MRFRSLLLQLEDREIQFPDGTRSTWEIAAYPHDVSAVAALGFLPALHELVMIRNYRPSLGDWSLEVAGGLPFAGESLADAVTREFREETGYVAQRVIPGPLLYSLPGVGHFPIQCFIVEAERGMMQTLDRNERIVPIRFPASRAAINETKVQVREPVSLALLDYFLRFHLGAYSA